MNQKITMVIVVISLIIGVGGFFYGLSQALESEKADAPVEIQTTPAEVLAGDTAAGGLRYDELLQQVAPLSGTTIAVEWGDMGQKLIEVGAIDLEKFQAHYNGLSEEQRAILLGDELTEITFKPENIQFWTNMLWALGLAQESKVLGEGPIKQREGENPIGGYASTGGWTLGSKPATELYNSARLINLTPEQDELVYRVAENVFRPCCGNHTAFPDCNHGMAVLGLLELLASQGATEDDLYQAALAFNAYAFTDSYVKVAAYFTMQDMPWSEISARRLLGPDYSSLQGARRIASAVGPIPAAPGQGGSCGA
jgi:hypothetical protein